MVSVKHSSKGKMNKALRLLYALFLTCLLRLLELYLRTKIVRVRNLVLYMYPKVFPPIKNISTELLLKILDSYLKQGIEMCDMGTGSGVLAIYAAKKGAKVIAVDISDESIRATSINAKLNNVQLRIIKSDLFKNLAGKKFDLIVFNPPYFPFNMKDALGIAMCSGKKYSTIIRFISQLPKHLKKDGKALITLSTLLDIDYILSVARRIGLRVEEVAKAPGSPGEEIIAYALYCPSHLKSS